MVTVVRKLINAVAQRLAWSKLKGISTEEEKEKEDLKKGKLRDRRR